MKIKKAVITAAGRNQNKLPVQNLVDRDGAQKSALQIIIEETVSAGVDEIGLVICPGDQEIYAAAAGSWAHRLHFVEQKESLGYGHAIYCAREFVARDSFLHLVSDHLHVSGETLRCAQQLASVAEAEDCVVSGVQATRESQLSYYGAVGGRGVPGQPRLYEVDKVMEKPTPTEAEQQLIVPGLRAGHYLCFFGMHILTPSIMPILGECLAETGRGPVTLSSALARLAERERYVAFQIAGRRFNLGVKFGLFNAQLALALDGKDREEVLAQMLELIAQRPAR